MPADENPRLISGLKTFSRCDGPLLCVVGTTVLLGSMLQSQTLIRFFPGIVAMNPLTAAFFVAAGISLTCFWSTAARPSTVKRQLGQALAAGLVVAGLLNVLDYIFGWNFRLDADLFGAALWAGHSGVSTQMGPSTAIDFLLSGVVLLMLNSARWQRSRLAQKLSLVVAFHSLLALLGYVYGAYYLYRASFFPMEIYTAALFFLLSQGLLFAQTEVDVMAVFVSNTPGGAIARRLLPFAFVVPAILGALRLWAERLQFFNPEFGMTLMVLVSIVAFTGLIWVNARLLNRADGHRREAKAELEKTHDELELRVEQRTGELLKVNEALRLEIAERKKAELRIREQADEQRKLEIQFLRAQRLESLGALAGGIAHDLNNALVPILVGSEMLRSQPADESVRQSCLDLITSSGQRCAQMVKQVLNFARGSRALGAPLQLKHLINEMTKIARNTFPKAIVIRNETPSGLWPIEGDPTEFHQVLMNLCLNARDAMLPQGGNLTLDAQNISLSAEDVAGHTGALPGPHVVVSVTDTGAGISPDLLPRIFEPFFTTKSLDQGTGLGLSTVASIVRKHKGFVKVRSELGKGTEFKISLRASDLNETGAAHAPPAPLPTGRGELILVVDDERAVVELAKMTLEHYGYRALTANNGFEAIACFEGHKGEVSLLVADADMPILDGFKTIKAIQKIEPSIPWIVASGTKSDARQLAGLDTTRLIALSKPYGVEQLLDCVAQALRLGTAEPAPARALVEISNLHHLE